MSEVVATDVLESCARRVEGGVRTTVEGILIAGEALAQARAQFGENDKGFGRWRQGRLPWLNEQTARNFMNVWRRFGSLPQNGFGVEALPAKVLYALAAPSTDDTVVEQAMEKADNGEKVTLADVRHWRDLAASSDREARQANERAVALSNQIAVIEAAHADEQKSARTEIADGKVKQRELRSQIKELQAQKTAVVKETIEVIPDGYASLEEAVADLTEQANSQQQQIAAAERTLAAVEQQLSGDPSSIMVSGFHDPVTVFRCGAVYLGGRLGHGALPGTFTSEREAYQAVEAAIAAARGESS